MSDMNQAGMLSAIERARLSAELLQVRAQLVAGELAPLDRARASARALSIRAQLGAPKSVQDEGQAAFDAARDFYQQNLKGRVINSVIGPVQVNGTGWKKAKQGMKADTLKAKLIEYVREILETGTAGQRQSPHKERTDTFVAFHFIQKRLQIGDLLVTAGVTVAEDEKGNLFYNVSHAGRDAWKAKENGATDYAGVGPRSDDAADGVLDATQRAPVQNDVEDTVADGDINITILEVVASPAPAANHSAGEPTVLATGTLPQKGGAVLVQGDPEALAAFAHKYLDQVKLTPAADGVVLSKSQAPRAKYFPSSAEHLPSGATLYWFADAGGVAVAADGELSGIARDLPDLKSVMAQRWGGEKYQAVFGEEAATEDLEAYNQEQADIAKRKLDSEQAEVDQAEQARLQAEQQTADKAAQEQELVALLAEQAKKDRAEFERTVGAGKVDNPIYQAYLDTLEDLPAFEDGNSGFLGWAGIRAGEFERQGGGRPSTNKDAYLAYVRGWADEHLAKRVSPTGWSKKEALLADAWPEEIVTFDQVRQRFEAKEGVFEDASMRGEPSADEVRQQVEALKVLRMGAAAERAAIAKYEGLVPAGMAKAFELWAIGWTLTAVGNRKSRQAAPSFTAGGKYRKRGNEFMVGAKQATAEARSDAAFLAALELRNPPKQDEAVEREKAPDGSAAEKENAPQIIEYKTRRDKILRGIIRTDLTFAEAKAIDKYTWRMNGGYFIREKHLEGDTSSIQAAPAPVVLTPEQEAEKQERDARAEQERQQQAIASQVGKLRQAGDKAIAGGQASMGADRKTNTSRRAGMAASAFARAAVDEAEGRTLNSIADAIEVGRAGALAQLSSRTQLQELKKALSSAKSRAEEGLSYRDQLERRDAPVGEEVLHLVRMPSRMVWATWYRDSALAMAKKAAPGNSRLIAAMSKMGQRVERWSLEKDADIAITRKAYQVLKPVKEAWYLEGPMGVLARYDRLKRMGITTDAQLQDACRALLPHLAAKKEESAVAKAERAIIGQKVGIDFFPTPAHVADRMAKLARIGKGDRVLEPSAGNGNLADAAAAAGGVVDVIEISGQLRDILTAKGYTVVDHDFMGFTPEQPYQAILMNPPFSKRQDAEHIMRAFGMLASGGTLVAIAGEGVFFGQDQKAEQFRSWLDQHGADVEKLDGGTFKDDALLAQTSANARLIVLRK